MLQGNKIVARPQMPIASEVLSRLHGPYWCQRRERELQHLACLVHKLGYTLPPCAAAAQLAPAVYPRVGKRFLSTRLLRLSQNPKTKNQCS